MSFPKLLPAGTVIIVGHRPDMMKEAVGLMLELPIDAEIAGIGTSKLISNMSVVGNPNGWHYDTANHQINLHFDTILEKTNKLNKRVLDNLSD